MRSYWNAGMTLNHLVKALIHFIQCIHEQPVSQLRRYRTNVGEKQFGKEPVHVISFRANHFFVPVVFKRFVHIKGKIDHGFVLRNQHPKYFKSNFTDFTIFAKLRIKKDNVMDADPFFSIGEKGTITRSKVVIE